MQCDQLYSGILTSKILVKSSLDNNNNVVLGYNYNITCHANVQKITIYSYLYLHTILSRVADICGSSPLWSSNVVLLSHKTKNK